MEISKEEADAICGFLQGARVAIIGQNIPTDTTNEMRKQIEDFIVRKVDEIDALVNKLKEI